MDKLVSIIGGGIIGAALIIFIGALVSFPVYWLWNNCLIGAVDGVHEITWLQAWGLLVLSNCLFKATINSKKD